VKTQSSSRIVLKRLPSQGDGAVRPFPYAAIDHPDPGLDLLRNHRLPNPVSPATDVEAGVVEAVAVSAEELLDGSGAGLEAAMSECETKRFTICRFAGPLFVTYFGNF